MSSTDSSGLLRADLLKGVTIALVGASVADTFVQAIRNGCEGLGGRVLDLAPVGDEATLDCAVAGLLAEAGSIEMLVVDAAALFARANGRDALVGSMETCWNVTRALVNSAFLASESSPPPARRIVYIAPRPNAGEHAEAMRAALENLARTLSIEWSRHAVTPVAIAPGSDTAASEVAALVAYLASPAGAYFSGCELDLRGPTYS